MKKSVKKNLLAACLLLMLGLLTWTLMGCGNTGEEESSVDMSEAGGQAHFRAMRKLAAEHPSEIVGEEIRKLYSWNGEDKLINN